MSRNWEIGDWAEFHAVRYLVYAVDSDFVYGVRLSGAAQWERDQATHLPDCTGFDWQPPKPIEPPPGYRLMGNDEIVKDGDKYLSGEDWYYVNVHGDTVEKLKHSSTLAYARKIEPQYRPFTNADEFAPYRARWWRCKTDINTIRPPVSYSTYTHGGRSFDEMFLKYEFEDGTPFGIATTEKEATCAK